MDLGRQLRFREHTAQTLLMPDLVLVSDSTKQVLLLDLTMPWEDRMEKTHEGKVKYLELVEPRGELQMGLLQKKKNTKKKNHISTRNISESAE